MGRRTRGFGKEHSDARIVVHQPQTDAWVDYTALEGISIISPQVLKDYNGDREKARQFFAGQERHRAVREKA